MLDAAFDYQDPRITRTRTLLVNAFNALLDEKGFETITVGDIATRATVNRATFYAHFEDKYALFAFATQMSFMTMLDERIDVDAPYDRDQLRRLTACLCAFLMYLKRACAHTLTTHEAMIGGQVVKVIENVLSEWLTPRLWQNHSSTNLHHVPMIVSIASWGMYGVLSRWIRHGSFETEAAIIEQVVNHLAQILDSSVSWFGVQSETQQSR